MNTVSTKNMILSVIIPAQNVYTYCNPNLCISIIHLRDNVSRLVMGQCSFLKSMSVFSIPTHEHSRLPKSLVKI